MSRYAVVVVAAFVVGLGGCGGDSGNPPEDAGDSTPCDPNPCTDPGRTQCVVEAGRAECRCDPGYHEQAGQCVQDDTCTPTTCNGHGTCDDSSGAPVCECDEGYTGPFCGDCDAGAGYVPDGMGGCTNDVCDPNPCTDEDRMRCVEVDGAPVCECNAGTHDDGTGACVPDQTCMPTTCSGHGSCDDTGGVVTCTCDTGWAGPFCGECDTDAGYHDDGAGDCTTDPCLPDPCALDHTECQVDGDSAVCVCEAGYHDEGGVCVADESCGAGSCSGHGACDDTGGVIACTCDAGYVGDACDACDTGAGYHDDGAGGCTDDACVPNPCTEPNKGQCTATGGDPPYDCACDPGYHDDGTGGCTDDPCLPNPCAVMDMACLDNGDGTYTCYTPDCDDGNPCTDDVNDGGSCVHTDVGDGTACSTTLCTSGQTCTGGACGGGTAVSCDDGKPCTVDSCDDVLGCQHANDDSIVPDDGVPCTDDECAGGVASHDPNHTVCDDAAFCTGVELCAPADPGADADGCIVTDVPVAPPSEGPCRHYGACDEVTDSFPLIVEPEGTACNDGIACTEDETCTAEGACVGDLVPGCPLGGGVCTTATAWPGDIDFGMAVVSGAITMNGAAPPATSESSADVELYLIDKTTGSRQYIGGLQYSGSYPYPLVNAPEYTARVVPGVYDLLYRRSYSSSGDFVYATYDGDTVANGNHVLMSDVVVAPGAQTLDIDFSMTTLSGAISMNGAAPPATSESSADVDLYLIDKTTGSRQYIGGLQYSGSYPYPLINSPDYTARIVPGVYDLLYRRSYSSSGDFVYATYDGDTVANGNHILMSDVVIAPGARTLDVDFSMTTLSGAITMNGGAPPATSESSADVDLYLIDKSTGSRQYIGGLQYSGSYPYPLINAPDYAARVVPGVYDLLYRRSYSSSGDFVYATYDGDTIANGNTILLSDVVIAPGAQTLDIDFSMTTLSGAISMNAGAPPATSESSADIDLYLIDRTTGSRQYVGGLQYSGSYPYPLINAPEYTTRVVPGGYDLLYRRSYSSSGDFVYATYDDDTIANGNTILLSDVAVAPGAQTLDIDFSMAVPAGDITMHGGAPPTASESSADVDLYVIDVTTGSRQYIGGLQYSGSYPYPLINAPDYLTRLVPGVYHLLYRRSYSSSGDFVYATYDDDTVANGNHLLDQCLLISP